MRRLYAACTRVAFATTALVLTADTVSVDLPALSVMTHVTRRAAPEPVTLHTPLAFVAPVLVSAYFVAPATGLNFAVMTLPDLVHVMPIGVTGALCDEAAPKPTELCAVAVKRYATPAAKPVTWHDSAPELLAVVHERVAEPTFGVAVTLE